MVLYMKSKIYYGSTSLTGFLFCTCSDYQQSTREPIQVDRLCCQRRQFWGFGGGFLRRNGQRDGGGLQCGHRCGGNHSLPHARSAQQDFCDLALDRTNTKLQWYQVQVTKKSPLSSIKHGEDWVVFKLLIIVVQMWRANSNTCMVMLRG